MKAAGAKGSAPGRRGKKPRAGGQPDSLAPLNDEFSPRYPRGFFCSAKNSGPPGTNPTKAGLILRQAPVPLPWNTQEHRVSASVVSSERRSDVLYPGASPAPGFLFLLSQ